MKFLDYVILACVILIALFCIAVINKRRGGCSGCAGCEYAQNCRKKKKE